MSTRIGGRKRAELTKTKPNVRVRPRGASRPAADVQVGVRSTDPEARENTRIRERTEDPAQYIVQPEDILANALREARHFGWFEGMLPEYNSLVGGAQREHPDLSYFLTMIAIELYGSERKAEAHFAKGLNWRRLRRIVRRLLPDRRDLWLPGRYISRNQYARAKRLYLQQERVRDFIYPKFETWSVGLCREMGLGVESAGGSWTHPSPLRTAFGDVKVVKPRWTTTASSTPWVDPETGEIKPRRYCHSARTCFKGDGEYVYGMPFLNTALHGGKPNECIFTAFKHVPRGIGGEGRLATDTFLQLSERLALQATLYDGVMTGMFRRDLLKIGGVIPIVSNGMPLGGTDEEEVELNRQARRSRRRVNAYENTLGRQAMTLPDGTEHQIVVKLYERAPVLEDLVDEGEIRRIFLKRGQVTRHEHRQTRRVRREKYFWYAEYSVPASEATVVEGQEPPMWVGGKFRFRLDQAQYDLLNPDGSPRSRVFNREHNLMVIPPSDPDYAPLYHRRQIAEVYHRLYDDTRMREWARSVEWEGVWIDLFAHYFVRNVIAITLHRRRGQAPGGTPRRLPEAP